MVMLLPFRFHPIGSRYLICSDAGDFFFTSDEMLRRMVEGAFQSSDEIFLLEKGFACHSAGDFYHKSYGRRLARRKRVPRDLSYIVVIPTLRCDLACTYCQVSRADVGARGVDWSNETLERFFRFLDTLQCESIKIEFQGGEPTLRIDLVEQVVRYCESHFREPSFVICTNLNTVERTLMALLERPGVTISTSLDGPRALHRRNRTKDTAQTERFFDALADLRHRFGNDKVSALPTITPADFTRITEVIDAYVEHDFESVYLRPVTYHGFARKQFPESRMGGALWNGTYRRAIDHIFGINDAGKGPVREFGLEVALQRIFAPVFNGHVDLRSPNPVAVDYVVIDYDGRLYPSDEARMLARIRHSDLSIGDLEHGFDARKVAELSWNQFNEVHEDCIHCAFQPFCGVDTIDDLARYDRIDLAKHLTAFCQSHMATFELVFEMLAGGEPRELRNLGGHLTGDFDMTPFFGEIYYDPADRAD